MSHRYFIVPGTYDEYRTWVNKNHIFYPEVNLHDFIYVHNSIVLRGHSNPHGFFIGTFGSRADLYEIVSTIIMCSHDMTKQAKSELIRRVLPTKKITP